MLRIISYFILSSVFLSQSNFSLACEGNLAYNFEIPEDLTYELNSSNFSYGPFFEISELSDSSFSLNLYRKIEKSEYKDPKLLALLNDLLKAGETPEAIRASSSSLNRSQIAIQTANTKSAKKSVFVIRSHSRQYWRVDQAPDLLYTLSIPPGIGDRALVPGKATQSGFQTDSSNITLFAKSERDYYMLFHNPDASVRHIQKIPDTTWGFFDGQLAPLVETDRAYYVYFLHSDSNEETLSFLDLSNPQNTLEFKYDRSEFDEVYSSNMAIFTNPEDSELYFVAKAKLNNPSEGVDANQFILAKVSDGSTQLLYPAGNYPAVPLVHQNQSYILVRALERDIYLQYHLMNPFTGQILHTGSYHDFAQSFPANLTPHPQAPQPAAAQPTQLGGGIRAGSIAITGKGGGIFDGMAVVKGADGKTTVLGNTNLGGSIRAGKITIKGDDPKKD